MTPPSADATHVAWLLDELHAAQTYTRALTESLTPDQIAWRLHQNSSAIGWHLGHQAAVTHFMVRNLTAAEPTIDAELDRLFDSATPEPNRGSLPTLEEILQFRDQVADSTQATMRRILDGDVGAPQQLLLIAGGLLRAVINHEYQHDAWVLEVRDTMVDEPAPEPDSANVVSVDGYWLLRA